MGILKAMSMSQSNFVNLILFFYPNNLTRLQFLLQVLHKYYHFIVIRLVV